MTEFIYIPIKNRTLPGNAWNGQEHPEIDQLVTGDQSCIDSSISIGKNAPHYGWDVTLRSAPN